MTTIWLFPVLERDLQPYLDLGWIEHTRDRKPSVEDDIVLIQWSGTGEPPRPEVQE